MSDINKQIKAVIKEFRKEFSKEIDELPIYFHNMSSTEAFDRTEKFLKQAITKSYEAGQKSREKEMVEEIEIIIPKGAETNIELGLVSLTEYLSKKLDLETSFGLGGENGYGVEFENDVFMMHPFCWCEEDNCKWCSENEPNFIFKPTGAKIWWYKWIGRSQEQEGKLPKNWLKECIKSLSLTKESK